VEKKNQTRIGNGMAAFNCGNGAWSMPSSSRSPPLGGRLPQQSQGAQAAKSHSKKKESIPTRKKQLLLLRVDEELLLHPALLPRPRLGTKLAPGTQIVLA
jgi:hypothetical protein